MVGLQLHKQSVTFIEMHLAQQRRVKILVQTNKLANPQNLLIRFLFFHAYRVTFGDPSTPHLQCFGAFDHHDVFEYLVTTKKTMFSSTQLAQKSITSLKICFLLQLFNFLLFTLLFTSKQDSRFQLFSFCFFKS